MAIETAKVKQFKSVPDLAQKLTGRYSNDLDKVRSIYAWITQNIIYDVNEIHNDSAHKVYNYIKYKTCIDCSDSMYNAKILDSVLRKKVAICDGYARLFKTLCSFSGIKSDVVVGMGKKSINQIGVYDSDHAWNTVFIKDKWFLLDACWGAGYCDSAVMKFTKDLDEFYFLSEPKHFSYTHFPDEKRYLLYDNPITKQQFIMLPVVYSSFFKHGFDSFTPLSGEINANEKVSFFRPFFKKENFSGVELKKTEIKYTLEVKPEFKNDHSVTIFHEGDGMLEYKIKK